MTGLIGKFISYFLSQMAYRYAFRHFKTKALLIYLKTIQATRRSLIVALLAFFALQLMIFGFLGSVIVGVWLLPITDLSTKLIILFGFFSCIFLIPALALCFFLSERFWFRHSGAEQMLKNP